MKKTILSITAVFFALSFMGVKCKKEPKIKPIYYLDQEIKDYTLFPVGSYWIYIDSITGSNDSINIIAQETQIVDGGDYLPYNYELFRNNIFSSYFNTIIYNCTGSAESRSEGLCDYAESMRPMFFSSKNIGYLFYEKLLFEKYYDSLRVKNNCYTEIKVFKLQLTASDTARYYWARNVGLIKKEVRNTNIWELATYKINN